MRRTMDKSEYGIVWQKRNRLTDSDFADDIAIVAEEENVCQAISSKCHLDVQPITPRHGPFVVVADDEDLAVYI